MLSHFLYVFKSLCPCFSKRCSSHKWQIHPCVILQWQQSQHVPCGWDLELHLVSWCWSLCLLFSLLALSIWPQSQHAVLSQTPQERFLVCCACGHSSPWKTKEEELWVTQSADEKIQEWMKRSANKTTESDWIWGCWPHTYVTGYTNVPWK